METRGQPALPYHEERLVAPKHSLGVEGAHDAALEDHRRHARVELHCPNGFAVREAEYGVGVRVAVDEVRLDGRVSLPHRRGAGCSG